MQIIVERRQNSEYCRKGKNPVFFCTLDARAFDVHCLYDLMNDTKDSQMVVLYNTIIADYHECV